MILANTLTYVGKVDFKTADGAAHRLRIRYGVHAEFASDLSVYLLTERAVAWRMHAALSRRLGKRDRTYSPIRLAFHPEPNEGLLTGKATNTGVNWDEAYVVSQTLLFSWHNPDTDTNTDYSVTFTGQSADLQTAMRAGVPTSVSVVRQAMVNALKDKGLPRQAIESLVRFYFDSVLKDYN